jgi:hypothetical protein
MSFTFIINKHNLSSTFHFFNLDRPSRSSFASVRVVTSRNFSSNCFSSNTLMLIDSLFRCFFNLALCTLIHYEFSPINSCSVLFCHRNTMENRRSTHFTNNHHKQHVPFNRLCSKVHLHFDLHFSLLALSSGIVRQIRN